jgi:hypothetical protein
VTATAICASEAPEVSGCIAPLDWRPIETAPKDTWVLVYCPNGEGRRRCHVDARLEKYGWQWGRCRPAEMPTHWMQLPEPPVSATKAKTRKYRVTAVMLGGVAKGARVNCVVSTGNDPYTTDSKYEAERIASECRALPESYRDVRVEQVPA